MREPRIHIGLGSNTIVSVDLFVDEDIIPHSIFSRYLVVGFS